jgi:hypothetical protein
LRVSCAFFSNIAAAFFVDDMVYSIKLLLGKQEEEQQQQSQPLNQIKTKQNKKEIQSNDILSSFFFLLDNPHNDIIDWSQGITSIQTNKSTSKLNKSWEFNSISISISISIGTTKWFRNFHLR